MLYLTVKRKILKVDFANKIKISTLINKDRSVPERKWLILVICILIKLNLQIKIFYVFMREENTSEIVLRSQE